MVRSSHEESVQSQGLPPLAEAAVESIDKALKREVRRSHRGRGDGGIRRDDDVAPVGRIDRKPGRNARL